MNNTDAVEQGEGRFLAGRKRNWRGQFVKNLRETPDDVRCWLIWSRYHHAWHRRSNDGGACGYTSDIAQAGVFIRSKASAYNDGDRNEAFHVSERRDQLIAARDRLLDGLANVESALIEARQAHPETAPASQEG